MTQFSRKKVLIIEDSLEDAMLFKEYLSVSKYYDYTVQICSNAASALQEFNSMDADCILLDYKLNNDDGLELMKKFRSKEFLGVPLIFTTAYATEKVIGECLDLGASFFLDKSKMSNETLNKAVYYAINNIYDESFDEVRSYG